jgi:two-component system sensor histidine kinase SenX3
MAVTAAGLAIALVLVLLVTVVSRRRLRHRLDLVVARLSEGPTELEGRGLERALTRLERTAESAVFRLDAAVGDVHRALSSLDALPQGIVLWDEAGEEVYRNEVASAFTDARHAEVLVEDAIQELLQGALAGSQQHRTLDLLGPPRRILTITAVPLDDGNRPNGGLGIVEDVSERRRLEAVRRDFVANISHELRTPIGALGLLAETIAAEDDAEVGRRLAARMTGEAHRVGRIIDDLLSLSQIEAEERPVREPVEIALVVAEAVDRVRSLAQSSGIALETDGVGRRHTVRGDRRQLVSAVANLLENACKYSDEGSTVHVSSTADGNWVDVVVRDEGIGIPTRDLERVFERFYRVDRARSRATGGTGLGLAIVRHVASNHRGDVTLHSVEGEGSTFTLRLPSAPGPVAVSA